MPSPTPESGVIAVVRQQGCYLVIRRSQTVRAPGMLCFPGGGVEKGESQEEALIRELEEELNAQAQPIRPIWTCRSASGIPLTWWEAELASPQVSANPDEVEAIFWLTQTCLLSQLDLLETNRNFLHEFVTS